MRLLNVSSGEITEFISDADIPPYAILSHTWGTQEITLADWTSKDAAQLAAMRGHDKIQYCREQAAKDGLQWIWVDTYVLALVGGGYGLD
jgi:hypothetical protein